MVNRKVTISCAAAILVLLFMLNFTTPVSIGPLGVLIFFVAAFVLFFDVMAMILGLFFWLSGQKKQMAKNDYACAAALAFGPIMLLLMQSFRVVSWWTAALVVLFVFLICFLIKKRA